jgi:hypothetical protein
MKKVFILIALFVTINLQAQDSDKTVTLTVTGQGKTIDEAKANALRGAIEQTFGAFISSNTTIFNDKLIMDDIVSVSNGNIQKYDLMNEITLPDGSYIATIKAIISVSKLTSFCESKGVKVEFKGGLFAMNMALQELYEKNETIAWQKTKVIISEIMKKGFDYKIEVKQPVKSEDNNYDIEIDVYISMNKNYTSAMNILLDFCKSISLNETSAKEYVKVQKEIYPIIFPSKRIIYDDFYYNKINIFNKKSPFSSYFIRNRIVANEILLTPWKMANQAIYNFTLSNGVDEIKMDNYLKKSTIKISENEKIDRFFSQSKGYVLLPRSRVLYELFGKSNIGGGNQNSKIIGMGSLYSIYNGDIFIDPNSIEKRSGYPDYSGYSNPPASTIVNFIGINEFLHLHFVDKRNIDEIKNITEYKIQAN